MELITKHLTLKIKKDTNISGSDARKKKLFTSKCFTGTIREKLLKVPNVFFNIQYYHSVLDAQR